MTSGRSAATAWCSPKGRVIVTGRLLSLEDAVGLILPRDSIDAVLRRLTMYRLRSKVNLDVEPDILSLALPGSGQEFSDREGLAVVQLSEDIVEVHGHRDILSGAGIAVVQALSLENWQAARIRAGLVDIHGDNSERYTPHMINLDRTGAVSFNKGCYTGQEVVARTENLGRVKRRAMRYSHDADSVAIGDRLMADDQEAGIVVNAAAGELLALVTTAEVPPSLTIHDRQAIPQPLPYSLD